MTDAWRYAVWPDARSRSRSWALESLKVGHFRRLSFPPFIMGTGKWPQILKLGHNTYSLSGPDLWFFSEFLCHVTLKLALSRRRPSVPYGANFCIFLRHSKTESMYVCLFLCLLCTATVLSGSGPILARGIVIPAGWSWGLASAAWACGLALSAPGKFGTSGQQT